MLNEGLYQKLKAVFGEVSVTNEGMSMVARACTRAVPLPNQRKNYLHIQNPGEMYRVNCPFCGDQRQRLYVNHRWDDMIGGLRVDAEPYTAVCYNEHCEKDPKIKFRSELKKLLNVGKSLPTIKQGEVVVRPDKMEWPGEVIPIAELEEGHPVHKYLEGRGFDIQELSDVWEFSWVMESDSDYIWDTNRLIVPIRGYYEGNVEMLGWQTRYYDYNKETAVPPKKSIPKYLTQGKKNQLLFNGYRAKGNSPVVLCEGTFDAVKFGVDNGVCAFGKAISPRQKELLWNGWGKYGADLVLALDPDVEEKDLKKLMDSFSDWKSVTKLDFPGGYDAADFNRDQLWAIVEAYGVKKKKLY